MEQLIFTFFSTREIATGVWVIIFLIWLILFKKFGKSIITLVKTLFEKTILVFIFSLSFTLLIFGILMYVSLSNAELWRIQYIKTIVLGGIFIGAIQTANAITRGLNPYFFREYIINSFTFVAIIGFFTSYFTFNIIIELILTPIMCLIFASYAMMEFKEKESPKTKKIQNVILFLGIIIFLYTCLISIENSSSLNIIDILIEFFIPILLSLFFIPFIYIWALYGKYQIIITRLRIKNVITKENKLSRKLKILGACGISYSTLINFEQTCVQKMYSGTSDVEFGNIIRNFKNLNKHTRLIGKVVNRLTNMIKP